MPVFDLYQADVEQRIKRAWINPGVTVKNRIKAAFRIQKNGQLTNLCLLTPFPKEAFNASVRKAIIDAAPFQPLPEEAPDRVDVLYTFETSEHDGKGRAVVMDFK